jgi:hypothetical protein
MIMQTGISSAMIKSAEDDERRAIFPRHLLDGK